jgi:hypothetical protein
MPELTWHQQRAVREVLMGVVANTSARLLRLEKQVVSAVQARIKSAVHDRIRRVMARHAKHAHPDSPHAAYYHASAMAVHHVHAKDGEDPHALQGIKEDLAAIDGIREVSQGSLLPRGASGWEKVCERGPAEPDTAQADNGMPPPDDTNKDYFGPWQIERRRGPVYKSLAAPAGRACCCAGSACGDRVMRGRCTCS